MSISEASESPGPLTRRTGRVVVLGQGYVGLPLAMRAVAVGYDVVGFDVDEARVKALVAGTSYVTDVSSDTVGAALATARYTPTSDESFLEGFDVAVIDVPTPLRDGVPDLSHVETAARTLAAHMRAGSIVILESTTYPGTTEELVAPLLEAESGLTAGKDFSPRATARRESTQGMMHGLSRTRPRWCPASTQSPLPQCEPFSTPSFAPPFRSAAHAKPSSQSCSRTRSVMSTSH